MKPDEISFLTTEGFNPATAEIDTMDSLSIVRLINEQDAQVAKAVAVELPHIAAAVDAIVERLSRGGHMVYVGAGTSGRLGVLDASECPPTFSVPRDMVRGMIAGGDRALRDATEATEDDATAGARATAAENVGKADVVVGITASGRTPFVLGAIEEANRRGAFTIGLACNRPSALEERVEVMIAPLVGPEAISGSTRMKAGTAQKMVLNMLSTATMIRLGKTYGNMMVDLRASNEKLRIRARRIVSQACGVPLQDAQSALEQCSYEAKTAIVMIKTGMGADQARQRLAEVSGFVRRTLENAQGG
jgi:N-acetylmuramic acid 6-phosphate etherase